MSSNVELDRLKRDLKQVTVRAFEKRLDREGAWPPRLVGLVQNTFPAFKAEGTNRYPGVIESLIRRYLPLYEFLTQPRSTSEFAAFQQRLYHLIIREIEENDNDDFIKGVLWQFGANLHIIPGDSRASRVRGDWESIPSYPRRRKRAKPVVQSGGKICTDMAQVLDRIQKMAASLGASEVPIFYLGGKWRAGVHADQWQTMTNVYPIAQKVNGLIVVGVETNEAIRSRRGQSVESLEHRMLQVARTPADLVFPVGIETEDSSRLDRYYEKLWRELAISYYVIGERNHEYFPKFVARARKQGIILLWDHETNTTSSSELLNSNLSSD